MTTMTHHGLFTHAQVNCVTDNVTLTTYVHGVTLDDAFNDGKNNYNDSKDCKRYSEDCV